MDRNSKALCFTLNRGKVDKDEKAVRTHDGCFRRFTFKADRPIYIMGLTFLGLPKKSKVVRQEVTVCIMIEESFIQCPHYEVPIPDEYFKEQRFNLVLKKEETSYLEMPWPVHVPGGKYVDLCFEIQGPHGTDGPATMLLVRSVMNDTVKYCEEGEFVRFDLLHTRSPLQIKEVHFLLP